MFVSIVIFSVPNQTCFFLCAFPTHWNWKVDQVLDEEHGEKWEVLRQSLRAVLHRTSWTRLVEFVGVVVIIWLLVHMTSMWCPHDFCHIMWHDITVMSTHYVLIIIIIYYHHVIWYSYLSLRWKNFTWNSQKRSADFAQRSAERRTLPDCVELTQVIPIVMVSVTSSHVFFWAKPDQKIVQSLFKFPSSLFSGRIKLIYVNQVDTPTATITTCRWWF